MPDRTCDVTECERSVWARGLCAPHYADWYRSQRKYRIICKTCGKVAYVARKSTVTCSRKCGATQGGIAYAGSTASQCTDVALIVRAPWLRVPVQSGRRWVEGSCNECRRRFVGVAGSRYCSADCHRKSSNRRKSEARRARTYGSFGSAVDRIKVFESDGYRCHLCGKKTDKRRAVPHPKAPTVDHIVPLSRGGVHEPSNCRTACFSCNVLKGNRGGGEQLLLIA